MRLNLGQLICSVLMVLVLCLLPMVTFIVVLPVFSISGLFFAMYCNGIFYIPIAITLVICVLSFLDKKMISVAMSTLLFVVMIVIGICMNKLLVNSNLKWIMGSAQVVFNAMGDPQALQQYSAKEIVSQITDNFMVLGIGYYLYITLNLITIMCAAMTKQIVVAGTCANQTKNAPAQSTNNHYTNKGAY